MFILCDLQQCNASLPCADGNAGKTASKAGEEEVQVDAKQCGHGRGLQPTCCSLADCRGDQSVDREGEGDTTKDIIV